MTQFPLPEWAQTADATLLTDPAECKARIDRFSRRIRIRNWLEYGAGAFAIILFGALSIGAVIKSEAMIGAAAALTVVGVGVVLWQLHRRASLRENRPEESCLDHLRGQYERQYQALRAVPLWYLGPLVPGLFGFYAAVTARVAEVAGWSVALQGIWQPFAISFGLFAAIALANWMAARALKRRIDEIDATASNTL